MPSLRPASAYNIINDHGALCLELSRTSALPPRLFTYINGTYFRRTGRQLISLISHDRERRDDIDATTIALRLGAGAGEQAARRAISFSNIFYFIIDDFRASIRYAAISTPIECHISMYQWS